MDHAIAARYGLADEPLDLLAMGPVALLDDLCARLGGRATCHRRKELWVTDRAIEIDDQAAHRRRHQRCPPGTGEGLRHDQRSGIPPAVGIQQCPLLLKKPMIGSRYPVAAVFTGDEEDV